MEINVSHFALRAGPWQRAASTHDADRRVATPMTVIALSVVWSVTSGAVAAQAGFGVAGVLACFWLGGTVLTLLTLAALCAIACLLNR